MGQSVVLESGFWLCSDRDQKRLGARKLGAAVELRFLDYPADALYRRLEARNTEGGWGTVPITREQLDRWIGLFQPPDHFEFDLFDLATREGPS